MLFPVQKAEKARAAEEKLQDLKVLVADLDSALASPDSGADPSSAKQIAKKYDVSFNELWDNLHCMYFYFMRQPTTLHSRSRFQRYSRVEGNWPSIP